MKKKKGIISPFASVSTLIFIIIGIVYFISDISVTFADRINSTVAQGFRRFMSGVGNLFPFSLFELLVILIPLIVFIVIRRAIKQFSSKTGRTRFVINLAAFVLLIYSGHLLALGVAHNTTSISHKMGLNETEVTEDNLSETLIFLRDEINSLADSVPRNDEGVFDPGYSFDEISEKVCDSYNTLAEIYGFNEGFDSSAKGVKNGWAMSYLGISGIYTYPTGEANVNTSYPAYVTIFTAAHEMSHQRGFLRENEANFLAFLITFTSEDDNLRYSGAMNIYNYFASALYRTNKELYYEIHSEFSPLAMTDIRAANAVSEKYGDTIFEKISDKINDKYLQASGSEGIISYSRVVELVLAYRNEGK